MLSIQTILPRFESPEARDWSLALMGRNIIKLKRIKHE